MVRKLGLSLVLVMTTGVASGQSATGQWLHIAESHDNDYSVTCTRANARGVFYSVSPTTPNTDYRVARDVSVLYGTDGRPGSISLMRGFVGANSHDVVTLASDVSCIIEKQ